LEEAKQFGYLFWAIPELPIIVWRGGRMTF